MSTAYDYEVDENKPFTGMSPSLLDLWASQQQGNPAFDPLYGIRYELPDKAQIATLGWVIDELPQDPFISPSATGSARGAGSMPSTGGSIGGAVPAFVDQWAQAGIGAAVVSNVTGWTKTRPESGSGIRFGRWTIGHSGTGTTSVCAIASAHSTSNTFTTTISYQPRLLDGFHRYVTPNWDGFGAEPITPSTVEATRAFLRMMPMSFGYPDVAPGADGTIGLEWYFTDRPLRKLYIDIGPGWTWKGFWRRASGEHGTLNEARIVVGTSLQLASLFAALQE